MVALSIRDAYITIKYHLNGMQAASIKALDLVDKASHSSVSNNQQQDNHKKASIIKIIKCIMFRRPTASNSKQFSTCSRQSDSCQLSTFTTMHMHEIDFCNTRAFIKHLNIIKKSIIVNSRSQRIVHRLLLLIRTFFVGPKECS